MQKIQKRKHHYVPRFYLNQFLDSRVQPPREPYLWVFDKQEEGDVFKRAPKNIGYETGFYDMKLIDGTTTTHVEDFFHKVIETPSSKILRKILDQQPITDEEKQKFAMFIFYSHARVPNYINFMNKFYEATKEGKSNEKQVIKDPEVEKMIKEAEIKDEVSTLEFMIELVKVFAPIIYNMNWQFLFAPNGYAFITSDNPVILNDPKQTTIYRPVVGWNNPNIQLTFPLSPSMCFLGTWTKKRNLYKVADIRFVRAVNFRTAFFATRYLFGSRPFYLKEEVLKLEALKSIK
ncbi:hypothetical protein ACH33_15780 [Aneurinibacillus sp. XH2]|uniref:DUF4238 domain-containing protein n=1 Tax=Aneurinibacillus sp. XH2 TaxID=1450761 RepID=UPI00070A1869|nr:DUF4238 domain-containing protein [Aneurinibacillus sp. XH2]AMA74133.1 hypothetical protein ACH33_15780 [Aneurinibacillus sp. XH2]